MMIQEQDQHTTFFLNIRNTFKNLRENIDKMNNQMGYSREMETITKKKKRNPLS